MNCSPMHVTARSNTSYVWTSLLHGRDIIRIEGCWRIGNGKMVDVWRDCWLLAKETYMVDVPFGPLPAHYPVANILNPLNGTWSEGVVRELFSPTDAEIILQIPDSLQLNEDRLIWNKSELGSFSVKSAYFLAREFLGKHLDNSQIRPDLWRLF